MLFTDPCGCQVLNHSTIQLGVKIISILSFFAMFWADYGLMNCLKMDRSQSSEMSQNKKRIWWTCQNHKNIVVLFLPCGCVKWFCRPDQGSIKAFILANTLALASTNLNLLICTDTLLSNVFSLTNFCLFLFLLYQSKKCEKIFKYIFWKDIF